MRHFMLTLALVACTSGPPHRPPSEQPFQMAGMPAPIDWDRYHDRLDACSQLDQARQECSRDMNACDETTMRRLQRDCSPFNQRR